MTDAGHFWNSEKRVHRVFRCTFFSSNRQPVESAAGTTTIEFWFGSTMMNDHSEFLDGVRVLDLTRLLPGPFATMLFADMGADVIKVEDPTRGDYARYYPPMVGESSAFFRSLNRNKRAVTLDLKADEGTELFRQLVDSADVVVESFRPGVLERLGFGIDALRERYPELIVCSITGYGQTGPKRQAAGHDANYLALSGLLDRNGRRGHPPHVPGFQLADIGGGALYAALGITSALYRREQTGEGTHLDISMTEGALSFLAPAIARHSAGDVDERGDGMLTGGLPSYRVYPTADDRYLAVAALEPKFWAPFVEAIGAGDLAGQSMIGGEDGREVARQIGEILESEPLDHWTELFSDLDVCVEPVLELDEVLDAELHRARDVFFEMQGLTHVRTPLSGEAEPSEAPGHGEDNDSVYGDLGVDDEELAELRQAGVI